MDFCDALRQNDRRRLSNLLSPVLGALPAGDNASAFEYLRAWLAGHECVGEVVVSRGMLRSEPPIKEFQVSLSGADPPEYRTIGIRVTKAGYAFDIR